METTSAMPQETIEYIHGPFDGHIESVADCCEAMPEELLCMVNENVFRLMCRRRPEPHIALTSIAIYERTQRNGTWVYLFVGALATGNLRQVCKQVGLMLDTANPGGPSLVDANDISPSSRVRRK